MVFVAKWVLLVPVKFINWGRTFRLLDFLRNPYYSLPDLHKVQLPGVWKNMDEAGKSRKTLENGLIQAPKFWLSIRCSSWEIVFLKNLENTQDWIIITWITNCVNATQISYWRWAMLPRKGKIVSLFSS